MSTSKISGQTVIAFILGVIVGIIIMSVWPAATPTSENDDDTAANQSATIGDIDLSTDGTLAGDTGATVDRGEPVVTRLSHVSVVNQPFGLNAVVTDVALNRTTWIAVKEELANGTGNILGARRLGPGLYEQAEIRLLRSTVVGGQYAVLLYEDNGDLMFDHKTDTVVSELGQPVVAWFTALSQ